MKKILLVAAFIAFGLTNASAQYNRGRDRDYNARLQSRYTLIKIILVTAAVM